jgi:hypothetical protein
MVEALGGQSNGSPDGLGIGKETRGGGGVKPLKQQAQGARHQGASVLGKMPWCKSPMGQKQGWDQAWETFLGLSPGGHSPRKWPRPVDGEASQGSAGLLQTWVI